MNPNEYKIVRISNIADFDFTGELGARYGGTDFVILAGKSLLVPLTVGDHLATHLARQILLKKAPIRDAKETDGKGSDRPLWDDQVLADLKAKIMTEVYTEDKPAPVTETERMVQKVKDLNRVEEEVEKENEGGNVDASSIVPAGDDEGGADEIIAYKDKGEVINELQKRGITFDARATKSNLEKLLG